MVIDRRKLRQKISCETDAQEPLLKELQMTVSSIPVTLSRYALSASNSRSSFMNVLEAGKTDPVALSTMPFTLGQQRFVVQRVSTTRNRIDATLRALAQDHSTKVTCRAITVSAS